jgi:hypothetical protein
MDLEADLYRCACCTKPIRRQLLMCFRHWRMVPPAHQRAVSASWRQARAAGSAERRLRALHEYHRAREAAVSAVQALLEEAPPSTSTTVKEPS